MTGFLKALRVLGDEGRLRILRLLDKEELSVVELQEILGMGQSRISMALSQLKQAGFVEVRRAGQKSLYKMTVPPGTGPMLVEALRHGTNSSLVRIPVDGQSSNGGLGDATEARRDERDDR